MELSAGRVLVGLTRKRLTLSTRTNRVVFGIYHSGSWAAFLRGPRAWWVQVDLAPGFPIHLVFPGLPVYRNGGPGGSAARILATWSPSGPDVLRRLNFVAF